MIVYNNETKTVKNKDGKEFPFFCGVTLNQYSAIFARIAAKDLSAQEGYDLFLLERENDKDAADLVDKLTSLVDNLKQVKTHD